MRGKFKIDNEHFTHFLDPSLRQNHHEARQRRVAMKRTIELGWSPIRELVTPADDG